VHPGLVGRDAEAGAVAAFLAATAALPRALVLEGEAGIGKTTLWRAGVERARADGYRVLACAPSAAEAQLSFVAMRDLLTDAFDDVAGELPAPQRRALAITLLREEPAGPPPDPGAIGVSLLSALRALSSRAATLMAIDDAQWLDAASAAALSFVLRRLRDEPLAVLLTRRLPAADEPLAGLGPGRVEALRLGPMSTGALARILRDRLGVAYPRPTLHRLHAAAEGNPFYALEAARALERAAGPPPIGAPLALPDSLRALVRERLAALPAATQEALLLASALPRAGLRPLATALGSDPLPPLRPAIDAGVVAIDRDELRFEHPLLAAAVYERASDGDRREAHGQLAFATSDLEERARHLALAIDTPDEPVAQTVEEAAGAAHARGAPIAAAELAAHAARLTPADAVGDARRRALAEVDYRFAAGDTARAATLLAELLEAAPAGPDRARLLSRAARLHHFADDIAKSVDLLYAALDEAGDDDTLHAEVEESLAWGLLLVRRDLAAAADHARCAAGAARRSGDDAALAQALAAQALTEFALGRESDDAMRAALSLEPATEQLRVLAHPSFAAGYRQSCADDLDAARETFLELRHRALDRGDESAMPSILNHLALVECHAGDWEAAARYAEDAHALAVEGGHRPTQASTLAKTAMVAARRGDVDGARDAARRALAIAGGPDPEAALACGGETAIWTLGFVELSSGDPDAADRVLRPLVDALLAAGIQEPGEIRCLPDEIEALIALGRHDDADALLQRLEAWAQRLQRQSALAAAGRCRGLLLAAQGDAGALSSLEAAAAWHQRVPMPFERGRTLLALGREQRRARRRRAARETLERARATFEELGSPPWARLAADELGRIGGRAPSRGELTPAERRIAELVAEGRTNREVADALVVSVHTVEAALTQAYRKLGVRSRTELARRFADPG
jgi:DNA-binding CsgD family transcriptional regulator/tetratricopeptide (TPR) repeat protein